MCGKLSTYRPRHHADCSHNKLLKLWSYVMAGGSPLELDARRFGWLVFVEVATQLAV
jgi:hypothetical protein